uniref:Uncharacterized protein n=1 Tax=Oryza brachyantha TaxID=4533 RepID=J3LU64_ORYBR
MFFVSSSLQICVDRVGFCSLTAGGVPPMFIIDGGWQSVDTDARGSGPHMSVSEGRGIVGNKKIHWPVRGSSFFGIQYDMFKIWQEL